MKGHIIAGIAALAAIVHGAALAAQAPLDSGRDTSAAARATPAPTSLPPWLADLQPDAFVSFGYTYNLNRPVDRQNELRVFDSDANTFDVDVAEFVLQKAVAKPGDAGFRVDLDVGGAIPEKSQSYGLSMGTGADLKQIMLSYVAPVGSGLRLDFGKTVTWLGYEAIDGYDGYNDNYSRSLLFNYAIPFTHTGVKATYAFNSVVTAMLSVTNGWDDVKDNNGGKSIGGQLAITPVAPVAIYLNYIGGPEKPDTNGYTRHMFDVVGTWKVVDALTVGVNGDYGIERGASLAVPGADAVWKGAAGYLRYALTKSLGLALRAETFHDVGGTRLGTGTSTTADEFTVTPSYRFTDHFLVRGDWRVDRASRPLFVKDAGQGTTRQSTLAMNAVFVY